MALEKIRRRLSIPSLGGQNRFRGIASIPTGSAFVVVSASEVTSGCTTLVSLGRSTVASNRTLVLSTNSLVNFTSFCIVSDRVTSGAAQEVCYEIIR